MTLRKTIEDKYKNSLKNNNIKETNTLRLIKSNCVKITDFLLYAGILRKRLRMIFWNFIINNNQIIC